MQRIEKNKIDLTFLERDVNASYLSVLTRFQNESKALGEPPYIWLLGVFPYRKKI